MSAARIAGRKTAPVPRTIGPVRTVAICRENRRGLRQGLSLNARASFVDRTFCYVERFDHALIVAVGGVIATDVLAARLLYDVGVSETGSALERRVVRSSEKAFGNSCWSALTIAVWIYQCDKQWKNQYRQPTFRQRLHSLWKWNNPAQR